MRDAKDRGGFLYFIANTMSYDAKQSTEQITCVLSITEDGSIPDLIFVANPGDSGLDVLLRAVAERPELVTKLFYYESDVLLRALKELTEALKRYETLEDLNDCACGSSEELDALKAENEQLKEDCGSANRLYQEEMKENETISTSNAKLLADNTELIAKNKAVNDALAEKSQIVAELQERIVFLESQMPK
jgi:myosin heavy subunit